MVELVTFVLVAIVYVALPALLAFLVIYWAVRLGIRHERDRKE
ncbi:MAG TPA: hypothetical protein VF013_06960 [Candidatus Limnocylindria bacterium]